MEILLYVYKIIYIDCSSKHIQFFFAKRTVDELFVEILNNRS